MRKFLLRLSFFAAYALMVQIVIPVAVDPANLFHAENMRHLPTEPNKNYIKMKYILTNPDKFSGYLFGSSRVGSIHTERIRGEKVYNMTYSVGLPVEHLANIRTMLSHDIRPSVIYIGLDNVSYTVEPNTHIPQPWRCPYEYLIDNPEHFYILLLNPSYTFRALFRIMTAKANPHSKPENLYAYGWWAEYGAESDYDWGSVRYVRKKNDKAFDGRMMARTLGDIREIVRLCGANNIELILFTNPMHWITYKVAIDRDYLNFLEGLAEITDFWNFSSLNDITLSNDCYLETSHYKAEVGDLIIDIMCNGKTYPTLQAQGFGVRVTRENVKDFFAMLKAQLTPEE